MPFSIFVKRGDDRLTTERTFQRQLIQELKAMFPGCIVLKNDPEYLQGIPDLLILYEDKWAGLECKRSEFAPHRPNQEYYIDKMNEMSYAAFIYPENRGEVLHALQSAFRSEE